MKKIEKQAGQDWCDYYIDIKDSCYLSVAPSKIFSMLYGF